ncbi:MAG: hypothetical protein IPI30_18800 [Saprospiraceae bacterium]|nr:hypothetical protein [Candidatus Vicinibacter affinis]
MLDEAMMPTSQAALTPAVKKSKQRPRGRRIGKSGACRKYHGGCCLSRQSGKNGIQRVNPACRCRTVSSRGPLCTRTNNIGEFLALVHALALA